MTKTFAHRISDSMFPVLEEYERWIKDPSEDKDVRPLRRAAAQHLVTMGARLPLPEFAPCLAVLYFAGVEFDSGWFTRAMLQMFAGFFRLVIYRGRPMWNDFYMCLWQLSRDDRYIHRLYTHFKHASLMQLNTGAWMVNSVCQQDEEFRSRWQRLVNANGPVFGGPITI